MPRLSEEWARQATARYAQRQAAGAVRFARSYRITRTSMIPAAIRPLGNYCCS